MRLITATEPLMPRGSAAGHFSRHPGWRKEARHDLGAITVDDFGHTSNPRHLFSARSRIRRPERTEENVENHVFIWNGRTRHRHGMETARTSERNADGEDKPVVIYMDDYRKARKSRERQGRIDDSLMCVNGTPHISVVTASECGFGGELSPELPEDFLTLEDATTFLDRVYALATQV